MPVPGISVSALSVLVMARSAVTMRVSVSVAELLPAVGSVVPAGAVMVAVLASEPVVDEEMVAVIVYVAVAPTAKLMVSLMEPEPLATQVAPAVATQVQVALVKDAGTTSATTAPTTADGPLLEAMTVYVTPVPGISVSALSVLVMARSAVTMRVSVSFAELLPGVGSVTVAGAVMVAMLVSEPVVDEEMVAVIVYVAVAPTARCR
jgi:hypothetical protein